MSLSKAISALESIRGTRSRNKKLEILNAHKDNPYLRQAFALTTNPLITYGIKVDPKAKVKTASKLFQLKPKAAWRELEKLLTRLSTRELSGHAAQSAVNGYLGKIPVPFREWVIRIINCNLDCGAKESTFCQVWPEMETGWGVPLANKAYNQKGQIVWDHITFPCHAEPKVDGFNISVPRPGPKYKLRFTIKGKKRYALSRGRIHYPLLEPLVKIIHRELGEDEFVVGEAYAKWHPEDIHKHSSPWGKASTMLRTGMTPTGWQPDTVSEEVRELFRKDFQLWLFEYGSNSFYSKKHEYADPTSRKKRRKRLAQLVKRLNTPRIKMMPCVTLHNRKELEAYYEECLRNGFEGIMIKDMKAPLENGRNNFMLKLKPDLLLDGIIVRVKRGNGKNEKWAGACDVYLSRFKKVVSCNLRTDAQRDDFWKHRKDKVGVQVEVRVQKEPKGREVSVSRFVRLERERFDLPKVSPISLAKKVGKATLK